MQGEGSTETILLEKLYDKQNRCVEADALIKNYRHSVQDIKGVIMVADRSLQDIYSFIFMMQNQSNQDHQRMISTQ